MPNRSVVESPRIDCDLIVQLLTETLSLLETDRAAAKEHLVHARTLVLGQPRAEAPTSGGLADWQVRRIVTYVHYNLASKLRIKQVAEAVHMSPSYLSRAFKATTGITYSDFVQRTRIDLAKWLLLTTETPVCDIALACGLCDQAHLTRVFKRSTGLPPRAWRRRLGNGAMGQPIPLLDEEAETKRFTEDTSGGRDMILLDGGDEALAHVLIASDEPGTIATDSSEWRTRRMIPTRVGLWFDPHDYNGLPREDA